MWARRCPGPAFDVQAPPRDNWRETLAAHLVALSPESRRNRFLATIHRSVLLRHAATTTPAAVVQARIDGAVCGVAEVHLHGEGALRSGEIALSVVDCWQGCGVGGLLLDRAVRAGRRAGARMLVVHFLRTNIAMRRISDRAGFVCLADDDPAVRQARRFCPAPLRLAFAGPGLSQVQALRSLWTPSRGRGNGAE